jgi:hypothetical protein
MVYVILQHGMSLKMGYVTRGQSSDYSRPYRKYDNPAENTIMVVFPGYSTSMSVQRDDEIHPFAAPSALDLRLR